MSTNVSVSVVIPCYQCSNTIRRAVDSIFQQTLLPAEVILVDDASTDRTPAVLGEIQEQYGRDWIIVLSMRTNGGPSASRNMGWAQATQQYIAFLDADDSWHPQKIEAQYGWMRSHPDVALTGHRCVVLKDPASCPGSIDVEAPEWTRITAWRQLISNRFSTPSVMLKASLPQRFAPDKRHSEDALLWTSIVLDGFLAYKIEAPLGFLHKNRYGAGGLSADMEGMFRGQIDAARRLYRSGRIQYSTFWILRVWLLVKYWRRLARLQFSPPE